MKTLVVKDLAYYRMQKTNQSDFEVFDENEPFLEKCYGSGKNIKDLVRSVGNFGGDKYQQLFYEFLQNAEDSNAEKMLFFYNKHYLLVVNDGTPFSTNTTAIDDGVKDDFFAFLNKEKGTKSNNLSKIGKYGMGSKLLYRMLCDKNANDQDDEMVKALIDDLKAPILFSWSNKKDCNYFDMLLKWDISQNISFSQNIYSNEIPLLTRIIYSYYPSYLEEKKQLFKSHMNQTLFTKDHLKELVDFLNDYQYISQNEKTENFNNHYIEPNSFPNGSLLFIPLGKGVKEEIDNKIEDIKEGAISALNFLVSVKSIQINRILLSKDLHKKESKAVIAINNANKAASARHSYFKIDSPTTGGKLPEYSICYPEKIDYSEVANRVNFYLFFPLVNEKHEFHFFLHKKNFSIEVTRQKINWENQNSLEDIVSFIARIFTNSPKKYEPLYLSILFSNLNPRNSDAKCLIDFKTALKEFLKTAIPTQDDGLQPSEQVFIPTTTIDIPLAKLGIKDHYWISKNMDNAVYQRYISVLEIKELSFGSILKKANPLKLQEWIQSLNESDYSAFLAELQKISSVLYDEIMPDIKWIPCSDEKWRSSREIQNSKTIFVNDKIFAEFKEFLTQYEVVYTKDITISFPKLSNVLKSSEITPFELIVNTINTNPNTLNAEEKWELVEKLRKYFPEESENIKNFSWFKNMNGQLTCLNQLVSKDVYQTYSSIIPHKYVLCTSEMYVCPDQQWLLQPLDMYDFIANNWEDFRQENSKKVQSVENFYKLLNVLYGLNKDNSLLSELGLNYIFTIGENFSTDALILDISKFNFPNTNNLIQKLFGKDIVHNKLLPLFKDNKSCFYTNNSLINKNLKTIPIEINLNEAKNFYELFVEQKYGTLFQKHFIFYESNQKTYITEKSNNIQQVRIIQDQKILNFLNQNKIYYRPLPLSFSDFYTDALPTESEIIGTLVQHYGFNQDFIDTVKQAGKDIISSYLKAAQVIIFSSNVSSFDVSLVELLSDYTSSTLPLHCISKEDVKNKVKVDNLSLKTIQFVNNFKVGENEYFISDIIPNSPYAKASILETLKQNLLNAGANKNKVDTFFNLESIDKDTVWKVLNNRQLTNEQLINVEQISFIIDYHQATQSNLYSIDLKLPSYSYSEMMDVFKKRKLSSFYKFFFFGSPIFSDFTNPSNFIFTHKKQLLIQEEILPDEIDIWASRDDEKKNFLIKDCGVRSGGVNTLVWRENYIDNKPLEKCSLPAAEDLENTIKWIIQQNNSTLLSKNIEYVSTLIEYYFNKENLTKSLYVISYTKNKNIELKKVEDVYYYISSESINSIFEKYREDIKEQLVDQILNKKNLQLICPDFLEKVEYTELFKYYKEQGTFISIEIKMTANTTAESLSKAGSREWDVSHYKKWKEKMAEKGKSYAIYLTKNTIPHLFDCQSTNNKINNRFEKQGQYPIIHQQKENNIINFFITDEEIKNKTSVEKSLYHYRENNLSSITADDLMDLVFMEENKSKDTAINQNEQQRIVKDSEWDLMKYLEEQGILSQEAVDALLKKGKGTGNGDGKGTGEGEGAERKRKEVSVNSTVGYKGESIIYKYLCCKYGEERVEWSSRKGTPEYDFKVFKTKEAFDKFKETKKYNWSDIELYVDAKTTGKSDLTPDAIPFYVKKTQLNFLKQLKASNRDNYILARLNLNDFTAKKISVDVTIKKEKNFDKLEDYTLHQSYSDEEYIKIIEDNTNFLNLSFEDPKKL